MPPTQEFAVMTTTREQIAADVGVAQDDPRLTDEFCRKFAHEMGETCYPEGQWDEGEFRSLCELARTELGVTVG